MRDRRSGPGMDGEVDVELERRLRAAFGAASAPGAPEAVHAEVSRLVTAPEVRMRARLGGRLSFAFAAAVVGLFVVLVGSLLSGGSQPSPSVPAVASASAESVPSPNGAAGSCDVSPVTVHGTWWREIGGPNAFFNWDGEARIAQSAPWKLFVRFDPDAATADELSVWAERLDTGERAPGAFNSRMDPSNIYRFDAQAPTLPGGLYFFEQPLPTPGCWRLTGAIGGEVVGTAVVEVTWDGRPAPTPPATGGPTPAVEPTPEVKPTPWPLDTMAPAADDILPLAGRAGLPGHLQCGFPFGFEGLTAPTGAEDRVGPEFEVLRESVALDGGNFWGEAGPDPTFWEAGRDASRVLFLYERVGARQLDGGPYLYIEVARDEHGWHWSGSGDCQPRALSPAGYGQATWALDPDFRAPTADTRTLHLLVQELACSGGRDASGRMSPAFVVESRQVVAIEVFVQGLPGEGDCPASPPTPAKLHLPAPLGDRTLLDVGAIGLGGSGG